MISDATAPAPVAEYDGPGIKWGDDVIAEESVRLPESLRAEYIWLKSYVRDALNRSVEVLHDQLSNLGIDHDKTTWSKILRGRWNRSAYNEPLSTPVISEEKLRRAVERLRERVKLESARGKVPFVMTSVSRAMFEFMDGRRMINRVNRFGIVVGATGSGKTATFKEYTRQRNHGMTWWMEAPASGYMGDFLSRLAALSGVSTQTSIAQKRSHLLRSVKESKVIIIDNAQDLYRAGSNSFDGFGFLRQLQDETNCVVILSITPTFEKELTQGMLSAYWEQFVGRSGGIRKWLKLPDYAPDEDVVMIAEAFGMRDAAKHVRKLSAIAREPGRIRILFDDLQDAKQLAQSQKQSLTINHLLEVREED
jgi:DNA transposition AAA+ family ATPase